MVSRKDGSFRWQVKKTIQFLKGEVKRDPSRPGSTHPLAPSLPHKNAGKRGKESQKSEARRRKEPRPAPVWGNQIGDGWKKLFASGAGRKDGAFPEGRRRMSRVRFGGQARKTIHAQLHSMVYGILSFWLNVDERRQWFLCSRDAARNRRVRRLSGPHHTSLIATWY